MPLTDAVQQALFASAASTWDELLAAAEDIIAEAYAAADEKVATAQTAAAQSQQARDQIEASNDQLAEALQSERDVLQHRVESLTEAHRALDTKLVAEQTRVEGLGDLTTELKRTVEQLTADVKNADGRTERAQEQMATAEQAHQDAIATLRAEWTADRDAIEQQRDDESARADTVQQQMAALDVDVANVTTRLTAECDAHDVTRSALHQAEQVLDARRDECHTCATTVAQRDEQLAAAEAARQQEKDHFTVLIAEKDQRVSEQAATMRDLTAALKRAQSVQRKSS